VIAWLHLFLRLLVMHIVLDWCRDRSIDIAKWRAEMGRLLYSSTVAASTNCHLMSTVLFLTHASALRAQRSFAPETHPTASNISTSTIGYVVHAPLIRVLPLHKFPRSIFSSIVYAKPVHPKASSRTFSNWDGRG